MALSLNRKVKKGRVEPTIFLNVRSVILKIYSNLRRRTGLATHGGEGAIGAAGAINSRTVNTGGRLPLADDEQRFQNRFLIGKILLFRGDLPARIGRG